MAISITDIVRAFKSAKYKVMYADPISCALHKRVNNYHVTVKCYAGHCGMDIAVYTVSTPRAIYNTLYELLYKLSACIDIEPPAPMTVEDWEELERWLREYGFRLRVTANKMEIEYRRNENIVISARFYRGEYHKVQITASVGMIVTTLNDFIEFGTVCDCIEHELSI